MGIRTFLQIASRDKIPVGSMLVDPHASRKLQLERDQCARSVLRVQEDAMFNEGSDFA